MRKRDRSMLILNYPSNDGLKYRQKIFNLLIKRIIWQQLARKLQLKEEYI